MDKPKRYAVISDDGEIGALIRDALIHQGHLARVARLVKNGNGVVMAQYHDTSREVAVRELVLHWADEVIVAGGRRAGEALVMALSFIHDHQRQPAVAASADNPQDNSFGEVLRVGEAEPTDDGHDRINAPSGPVSREEKGFGKSFFSSHADPEAVAKVCVAEPIADACIPGARSPNGSNARDLLD